MTMDPSALMELALENPQAEPDGGSPKDPSWWPTAAGLGDMNQDLNSIHAANATCAAFHADVAAKHAASLAQWVQYLWGQIASLQTKIFELEDWKKKTLDDMSKLRFEHKLLRRRLMPDDQAEDAGLPGKAKSLPLLLAEHVDSADLSSKSSKKSKATSPSSSPPSSSPASMRPPPGLEMVSDGNKEGAGKRVSFAPPMDASAPATPTAASPAASSISPTDSVDHPLAPRSLSELSIPAAASPASETSPTAILDESLLEGVHVTPCIVDGIDSENAEWRIGHLSTKLRGCMGRALVSSPFTAWGLEDLRLMVFPDGKEVAKGPRSRRQKELYAKKVSDGPLEGCLKLKVPDCPAPHTLTYYLKIGDTRKGPFEHNFAESTVNGCVDFGIDWLKQVDADHSLTVSVQILRAGAAANAPKAV
mmetsp:Transcript_3449/g.9377  ORF Transcript_3449/g.9377 Transcript_3449/m.9377 type:complete len:420 (-) Transcript_3449:484-1743(-)